jgi:hypothetical protein
MWNAVVVVVLAWWSLFWHLVETQELHHGNLHVHDHGVYVVAVADCGQLRESQALLLASKPRRSGVIELGVEYLISVTTSNATTSNALEAVTRRCTAMEADAASAADAANAAEAVVDC